MPSHARSPSVTAFGTDALLFHERLESLLIHGHALVSGHLDGQVDGEAIGVIKASAPENTVSPLALCSSMLL